MGTTQYYSLAFFDFRDDLSTQLNSQKEKNRFVLIDKQLYGLYNIFGNGVVEGWTITDNGYTEENGIAIAVSPGLGIVRYLAAETSIPYLITGVPANSSFGVYASLQGSTPQDRKIRFVISQTVISSDTAVKLADVTTSDNGVTLIDTSGRQLISFEALIEAAINTHKHRGTPTKIDLENETKNQLPGAKIENIDASKITNGTLPLEQVPILDHNDLENKGLHTHAALDTFVASLSTNNKELLGEISSINLLRLIIFMKYKYSDVDEHFVNELALIPGISSNSFIDFNASTANIDLVNQCISGLPTETGTFTDVKWDDDTAFNNAYEKVNVEVANDKVTLPLTGIIIDTIENFEGVSASGDNIPGFDKETVVISNTDKLNITASGGDAQKMDGEFGGKFVPGRQLRAIFTKEFTTARNWTNYDELVVNIKTITSVHGPVYAYFVNESNNQTKNSKTFTLLAENHVTSNSDETKNNFEEKVFDISDITDRDNVTKFIIYTNDTDSSFYFYLDDLYVRKENLVSQSGTISFRYSTTVDVGFHSIFYDSITPGNTDVRVRVKTANSTSLLSRASWSRFLETGSIFATEASAIEIQVSLVKDENNSQITPTLNSLTLRLLVSSDNHGFDIQTASEWALGDAYNIDIEDDSGDYAHLEINSPINVNGRYFAYADTIGEIDNTNNAMLGISGAKLPISPSQAINWDNNPVRKFNGLVSVVRTYQKHYIVADKINNRVFEIDNDGDLVKGFASTYTQDEYFYPMTSVYNPNNGVLTIVCSQGIQTSDVDVTKISLYIGSTQLQLDSDDTIITGTTSRPATDSQVLDIQLEQSKITQLSGITSGLYVDFADGAFPVTIKYGDTSQNLAGFYGIDCFVGNFTYMTGIRRPVFANILDNGQWIIANSSVWYNTLETEVVDSTETIPDILQWNASTFEKTFSSSGVKFSDYSLGSIYEFSDSKFLVAGLVARSTALTPEFTGEDLKASVSVVTDKIAFRASAIDTLVNYRGVLAQIDRTSGSVYYKYYSPDGLFASDVDVVSSSEILVTESSFGSPNGRIAKLDNYGNVTWVYGNNGTFNIVNDAKSMSSGNVIVSV